MLPVLVLVVVGPTASGKSDLGIALARATGGEVVSADAMQLYRGMDVGTAKVDVDAGGLERHSRVRHHLLDVWHVCREASVARYQEMARAAFDDIQARGRRPLLVGGSGLYVRAALDRLEFPVTDAAVRARVEAELAQVGAHALHARLAGVDAVAAERIEPANSRRVVRALEVMELTGRPFSASMPQRAYEVPAVQIGLRVPRPVLRERIAERVDRMWDAGLVEEVRQLAAAGLREGGTARRALGYAQALSFLDGELSEDEARRRTVDATRRYARRQESWFRADPRITWVPFDAPDLLDRALAVASAP